MNALTDLLSSAAAQRIGWALIHFLWQGAAVALALAAALSLLRRRSAQLRWVASCAALALMAALPVATALVVSVEAPRQPQVAMAAAVAEIPVSEVPARPAKSPANPGAAAPPSVAGERPLGAESPARPASAGPAELPAAIGWPQRLERALRPVLPWATLLWLAGVAILSVWHLGGWLQVRRMKRSGTRPAEPAVQEAFEQMRHRLGIRRPVRLLDSLRVGVPVAVGWLRPAVLLPVSAMAGLTQGQLEAILAHELAHVRRWDCLVQALQAVMETLLFYHPAVWWVSRQIRRESELCCDDVAVDVCRDRRGYAHALAKVAELGARSPVLAAAASGGALLARIRRLVGPNTPGTSSAGRCLSGAAALMATLTIAVAFGLSCSSERALQGDGDQAAMAPDVISAAPAGSLTCSLDATIYEVRLPPDQVSRLDVAALTSAASSPAAFEKALAGLGQAKVLYRTDQSVRLSDDRVMVGAHVPMVMSTRVTSSGQKINTVQYQSVGAILKIAGSPAAGGGLDADLSIEVAAMTDSDVRVATQPASTIRNVTLAYKGSVAPGKPVVVVSGDAGSPDAAGKAVAYVARIILGRPQSVVRPAAPASAPAGSAACPLDATIYEIRMSPEQVGRLDAAALTSAAGSPAAFEKALAGLGQAKVLYRMDQPVRLSGDRIVIGTRMPMVVGSRIGQGGQAINTIEYRSVGAILTISGSPTAGGGIGADLGLEVAAVTDSTVKVMTEPASVDRNALMAYKGSVRPGRPVVVVSADAGSPDAAGKAVAYVARIILGRPQTAVRPAVPASAPAAGLTCPLDATIYEVRLPPEQVSRLDAAALTSAAASPAAFEKALAALGQAKVLYRMDQPVRLAGDRITISNKAPMVVGSRVAPRGETINMVQYQSVGAVLTISGAPEASGGVDADLGLEVAAMTDSAVKVATQPAAAVRNVTMSYRGSVTPGKPVVVVSSSAGTPDSEGMAVAYVARIILGKPH